MIDFEWTIQQIFDGIPRGVLDIRGTRTFLRPHDAIWPEDACQFRSLADRIYNELPSPQMKRQFLDVCLASYFLNPPKAPATVPSWIQDKCPIADLLGGDISLKTATGWHWGRAAIPVVDDLNKGHADRIVYALVAFSKGGSHPLYPDWAKNCLKSDTVDAVETAADLIVSRHSAISFFFWPLIDPQKPVSGRSLGLPVYLSFLSLVKGGAIPPLLATGALDRQGTLIPVKGLPEKLDLAYQKQFKGFIYPKDGYLPLEAERRFDPQGVSTLEEAEQAWGIGPACDLTRLRKILKPVPFEGEIDRLTRDFTGRTKLFEQIDQWTRTPDGEKVFWFTGEPGIGKSAIAAQICTTRNYIAAYHFCDFNSEEKRDPAKLVRSLTYQLAVSIPEFGERLNGEPIEQYLQEYSEAYTLFDKLIIQPLSDNFAPPNRCMVILIDALDEATSGSRNEIASILSQVAERVPSWLRFIVTSRPEQEISTYFHAFSKHEIEPSNQDNQDDISAYLKNRLPGITQKQIETILERSDGNFLYVRHITEEIRGNHLSLDRLQEFPKGLSSVYYRFFDRQFGKDLDGFDNEVHPLLCLVLAAFEPLTVSLLRQVLGIKDRKKLLNSLKLLGALFPAKGEGDSSVIVPWHRSLMDWLTTPERSGHYYVDIDSGHSMLAEYGWEQYQKVDDNIHPYFLAWLPRHLVSSSRNGDAVQFLKDFNIMMARVKAGLLERMLADYREIRSDSMRLEEAFFRENAHILRRGDEVWSAYKILLQLAIEHADNSPLTEGADQYLKEEKCNWPWLRRELRTTEAGVSLCLSTFEGHTGVVQGAMILPDKRILSWSWDTTLRLWNLEGKTLKLMSGHAEVVLGAVLFSDGGILSWSADSTLRIWDQDGNFRCILEGHTKSILAAQLLPNDNILSWSEDNTLRLWSRNGKLIEVMEGHTKPITGVKSLDNGRLLSWSEDNSLRLWGQDGKVLSVLEGHSGPVIGVLFFSDGSFFSFSEDDTLRLWDADGKPLGEALKCIDYVKYNMTAPDGYVLSFSEDRIIRIWDKDGNPLAIYKGGLCLYKDVLFMPDGRVVTWTFRNELRICDRENNFLEVLKGHSSVIEGAIPCSNGRILSWSLDSTLRLWGPDGALLVLMAGHSSCVMGAIQLSENKVLSWSADKTLRLWNLEGTPCKLLEGHRQNVEQVNLLQDDSLLSCSMDSVRIWDKFGKQLAALEEGASFIDRAGAFLTPDGLIFSWSGTLLRLWEQNGNKLLAMKEHPDPIRGILLLQNGGLLSWTKKTLNILDAHGYEITLNIKFEENVIGVDVLPNGHILSWLTDSTLRIWDPVGNCVKIMRGHTDQIDGVQIFPNGRILSWSYDKTLRLWNQFGKCISVMRGHQDEVSGARILPNGCILSWSNDATLRLWDKNGRLIKTLKGHSDWIGNAQMLDDGRLVSWSLDGTHCIWDQNWNLLCMYDKCSLPLSDKFDIEIAGKFISISHTALRSSLNTTLLETNAIKTQMQLRWEGHSQCTARYLCEDGRLVVTQQNGQVCFLRIYIGNNRAAIDELEIYCRQQNI